MSLVSVLTLLFISTTLALNCPPGYFKEKSNGPCIMCQACGRNMILKCTEYADHGCVCKEGFYYKHGNCHPCKAGNCEKHTPQDKKNTITTPTTTSTTTSQGGNATLSPTPPAPAGRSPLVWLLLLVLLLPLVYCVLLLFIRNMEAPPQTVSEQGCLQSPTTLKFTISEETPMMEVMSPPAYPAHSPPLLPEGEHRVRPDQDLSEPFPAVVMYAVIKEVPLRRWKEFLRLLSVEDQQLERVELDAGSSSMERQYQQLRLWSQKSSASMEDVYSALRYMELAGCAEMIMESLEKLHWRPQCVTISGKRY